jgi:hypothetical protein
MSSGPNVEDYTPAGWEKINARRWRRTDEIGVMHLLLRSGETFCELHGLTLHIYRGPKGAVDDAWPMGDPSKYDPAVHNFSHDGSHDVSDTALARYNDEDDAWKWLERYAERYATRAAS